MSINSAFRNFSGGEIAPALYARTDLAKYQTSARQMRNFVAQRHGGATMRTGTEFSARSKSDGKVRMIPFISSDDAVDLYALEFGNHYIRFHQGGKLMHTPAVGTWGAFSFFGAGNIVLYGGSHFYCKSFHLATPDNAPGVGPSWQTYWQPMEGSIIEVYSPYRVEDLAQVRYGQVGNTLTLVHPSYPVYELTRQNRGPTVNGITGPDQWLMNPAVFGSSLAQPANLRAAGGTAGNAVYWAVTAVNAITGEESLPSVIGSTANNPSTGSPVTVSWDNVAGATKYNVYRSPDGITFGLAGVTAGSAPTNNNDNTTWLTSDATVATTTQGAWTQPNPMVQCRQTVLTDPNNRSKDGKYTVRGQLIASAMSLGSDPLTTYGRIRAYYSRDGEGRLDAGVIYASDVLIGEGVIGLIPFVGVVVVPDTGYSTLVIDLVPEVIGTALGSGVEFSCSVEENAAPDNSVIWSGQGITFLDTNTEADNTQNPPTDPGYFQNENDYPATVSQYQQRRLFGRSNNNRGRIWASRVASPRNFLTSSPLTDNAAIVFDMDGVKAVSVQHLLDLERLITFTSIDEKVIEGEAQTGILKPDALNVRSYSYNGTGSLHPIPIGSLAIYLQTHGNQIRLIKYGTETITADLTIMAAHLFDGRTIVDWDYAKIPNSVIWAVRSDGTLLGLTFLQDADVWGWHRHDTDGKFESVCVLPEDGEDRVYVSVSRLLNGVPVRCIERMAKRTIKDVTDIRDAHYMDAGVLAYDGRNTDVDNVLSLVALPVEVLATEDGQIIDTDDPTVSDSVFTEGSITATLVDVVSSKDAFTASDVGKTMLFISPSGKRVYFNVTAYASTTNIQGYGEEELDDSFFGTAFSDWSRCTNGVGNLRHLIGEQVSVLADGLVLSSPNNPEYPTLTVDGNASLSFDHVYSVIRVGLPFIADLETLDIDSAPSTRKTRKALVSRVVIFFENSAPVQVGQADQPTDDNAVFNLVTLKIRDDEDYTSPVELVTADRDITTLGVHNTHGRVLIRQLDPLPTTILMVAPTFAEE